MPSTSTVITAATVTLFVGLAGYAIYFDYVRRNNPEFRKRLRKEKKRVDKSAASMKAAAASAAGIPSTAELREAVDSIRAEKLPETADGREKYFASNLANAEQLGLQNKILPAATCLYRAMRVYPQPVELMIALEQSFPAAVFKTVMEMMTLEVATRGQEYYNNFPPKYMNVKVETVPVEDPSDPTKKMQRAILVATKDFKTGDEIYKEKPVAAVLDIDLIGTGKYCSQCLRATQRAGSITAPLDPLQSTYCSKACQQAAEAHWNGLLFAAIPPPTPTNPTPKRTKAQVDERRKVQEAFIAKLKDQGKLTPLLITRIIGRMVEDEHEKIICLMEGSTVEGKPKKVKTDLPEPEGEGEYSFWDHMERLRYLEILPNPADQEVCKAMQDLLKISVEGLEEFIAEERYLILKGKMAYNCFGVCYEGGRNDRPQWKGRPEDMERTRTPNGTAHQIGSAFYRVSTYLNHSCAPSAKPAFTSGTAELHLVATRDIKAGEEVTVSYVDTSKRSKDNAMEARRRRRMELARGWHFACSCTRCEEEKVTLNIVVPPKGEPDLPPQGSAKLEPAVERFMTKNAGGSGSEVE